MARFDRRVIDAVRSADGEIGRPVQTSLAELRKAAGLTQHDIAAKLGVNQAAVSKIENREDVHLSSLQRYVEALGANLRIVAEFPPNAAEPLFASDLRAARDSDEQMLLPIFRDEENPSAAKPPVVLSIHPEYSEKILRGEKKVELRRRFPSSLARGSQAFIYSTSPARALVGMANLRAVSRLPLDQIWAQFSVDACVTRGAFDSYFSGLEEGYALHLERPERLDRAIPLDELRTRFAFNPPQSFAYLKDSMRRAFLNGQSSLPH